MNANNPAALIAESDRLRALAVRTTSHEHARALWDRADELVRLADRMPRVVLPACLGTALARAAVAASHPLALPAASADDWRLVCDRMCRVRSGRGVTAATRAACTDDAVRAADRVIADCCAPVAQPASARAALGIKTYRITATNAYDGSPVALPISTVSAFDAASARRKAMHKLGGFTIGYVIAVAEIR